ncbi:MAG TPA: glycoside hydrolase family 5 protein [Lacunisphaera sp.]|nr:glycoside hydrolase family 5 protein [Lacunisphaera sp.]
MTKPMLALVATTLSTLLLASCAAPPSPPTPVTPGIVSAHGRLRTAGNRIVGEDGRPVSLAGVSFGWSQWEAARFYNAGTVNWLRDDWHAAIVRAPLGIHEEDGYLQHPGRNLARLTRVVDAAIAADLYVLIDWHDHNAHLHEAQAVAFFTDMARRYGQYPHVIYEIFNEPLAKASWAREVKPYAEKVIAAIRAIDPDNLIVVGTPNFSQQVDVAAADPIKDPNVAYVLHFYAGTHKQSLRARALKALNLGAPLFVTEWGTCNADGGGPINEASVREWLAFLRDNQISHCNWAVYDKKETAAIVRHSAASKGGWAESDLSPSGKYARDLVRGWSAPSSP